jgi:peptidoglycan-N-acetylglucosamine deacetylase
MTTLAQAYTDIHYPEDRTYNSSDRGYNQYGAPSLHQTGKYALTFDDGPHPVYTPIILDALKAHQVKATFFVVTSLINDKNFPIIKRMLDEGHIVASHGRNHDNSNRISRVLWKSRVKQSFIDLAHWYKKAGHEFNKHYYRFPYAAYGLSKDHHHMNTLKEISRELMGDNCIHFAFWDIDSGDWIPGMTGAEVLSNFKASNEGGSFVTYFKESLKKRYTTIKNPTSGGVVLQHDVQKSSADSIKALLNYVRNNQLEIVPLNEVEEFKITKNCKMK